MSLLTGVIGGSSLEPLSDRKRHLHINVTLAVNVALLISQSSLIPVRGQAITASPQPPYIIRGLNADTSRGIPKTLYPDATTPFKIPLTSFAGRLPWQIDDTSFGTPKTLTLDATKPFLVSPLTLIGSPPQQFAQSFGMPLTLAIISESTNVGKHHPEYDIRDPRHPYWRKREVVKDEPKKPEHGPIPQKTETLAPIDEALGVNRLPQISAREALASLLTDKQRTVLDEIQSQNTKGIAFNDDDDDDDILLLLLID